MIIKFLNKRFNSIKMCAVFTATCFIVSTLGANLYAIPLAENANKKYEDVFSKTNSISTAGTNNIRNRVSSSENSITLVSIAITPISEPSFP